VIIRLLGSALEIISDTEWLSDEENKIKEGSNLKNKNIKKLKNKPQEQKKQNPQSKLKSKEKDESNVKIKAEAKEKNKTKEGESLLDLLELEMRARAIRALIRKEEDSSNSNNVQIKDLTKIASESGTSSNKNTKARQENLKEQLEKIDVLMNHGEDEDVFVVIQPAPTIELLSSESETDDHSKRVNQKLVNERTSENKKIQSKNQENQCNKNKDKDIQNENNKSSEKNITVAKEKTDRKSKNDNSKESANQNEKCTLLMNKANNVNSKIDNSNKQLKTVDLEDGEIIDDNESEKSINEEIKINNESPFKRKIKKVKKSLHIRSKKKNKENYEDNVGAIEIQISENEGSKSENENNISKKIKTNVIEIEESPEINKHADKMFELNKSNNNSKIDLFDDKSLDIDEVINLDDYPDDMDELEKNDVNNEKDTSTVKPLINKDKETNSNVSLSSETWATRYYKQDDVQNVIKESKIQSEIRKRLRERQRQSKLNNSPKLKHQDVSQQNSESVIPKPTGSVEEYLALKGISSEKSNSALEIIESSELLQKNDLLTGNNGPIMSTNSLIEDTIEKKNNLFVDDNKAMEQPIVIVKEAVLSANMVIPKTVNSTLKTNVAVDQLNKRLKSDDFHEDISASCVKGIKIYPSENSGLNKSNNFKEIICPLRINKTSLNSNLSDKTFIKVNHLVLNDEKLVLESNNKIISEEQIILSNSKTSELRPD
jgi:hypothetical protein